MQGLNSLFVLLGNFANSFIPPKQVSTYMYKYLCLTFSRRYLQLLLLSAVDNLCKRVWTLGKTLGLICIQIASHSDCILERYFENDDLKKSVDNKKQNKHLCKITQHVKRLICLFRPFQAAVCVGKLGLQHHFEMEEVLYCLTTFDLINILYMLLYHCLLVLSADNLCKQFGPSSGPTECRA